jgi:hypothetical protein
LFSTEHKGTNFLNPGKYWEGTGKARGISRNVGAVIIFSVTCIIDSWEQIIKNTSLSIIVVFEKKTEQTE